MGVLIAKYEIFNKIKSNLNFNNIIYLLSGVLIILVDVVGINIPVLDEFIVIALRIIFIYILVCITPEKNILNKFSRNCTNVGLTHSFFCYYLLQKISFTPKYSLIILLWILTMSLITSVLINRIIFIIENLKLIKYNITKGKVLR